MTVRELHEIMPCADLYELRPDVRYIIVIDKSRCPTDSGVLRAFGKSLHGVVAAGSPIWIVHDREAVKFFDLKGPLGGTND